MESADFLTAVLFVWEKSYVLCKTTVGFRKIVYDGLSKEVEEVDAAAISNCES